MLTAPDTESFDGGGFAPPASASRGNGNGNGNTASARSGSFGAEEGGRSSNSSSNYPDGVDRGGYDGQIGGGGGGGGGIDDPLTRANQQQQQKPSPPPPPRWLEEQEQAAKEVPSWLGQSSLGSSRRTGSTTDAGRAPVPAAEQHQQQEYQQQEYQQQEYQQRESFEDAGSVWGEGSAGVEETADWSNSGSVV